MNLYRYTCNLIVNIIKRLNNQKSFNDLINKKGDILVSVIYCPLCKTKNSKKAEICYNCKKPLKPHKSRQHPKKLSIFTFNPKSKIDFKIIAIGVIIFVLSNIVLLNIAYDYSILISGFATMVYMYFVLKNSPQSPETSNELKNVGFKIIANYLIIAITGILILFGIGFGQ